MNNQISKATKFINASNSILGGWFLFFIIIICSLTFFMTICNAVVYFRIGTNDTQNPDITDGFAWVLFSLNIILALLSIVVFFYVLLKISQIKDLTSDYVEFTTQNVVAATFDKVHPLAEQRKQLAFSTLPIKTNESTDILKPNKTYTSKELENLTYQLRPEFMPTNMQAFMNKYD
jgi:hypothetical protein